MEKFIYPLVPPVQYSFQKQIYFHQISNSHQQLHNFYSILNTNNKLTHLIHILISILMLDWSSIASGGIRWDNILDRADHRVDIGGSSFGRVSYSISGSSGHFVIGSRVSSNFSLGAIDDWYCVVYIWGCVY